MQGGEIVEFDTSSPVTYRELLVGATAKGRIFGYLFLPQPTGKKPPIVVISIGSRASSPAVRISTAGRLRKSDSQPLLSTVLGRVASAKRHRGRGGCRWPDRPPMRYMLSHISETTRALTAAESVFLAIRAAATLP